MKLNTFGRRVSMLALTGTLIGIGCGVAAAATPPTSGPQPHLNPATPARIAAVAPVTLAKSTLSIGLWNNSSYNLVLQSATGDNGGVPANGSMLTSGQNRQDFEVVYRALKSSTTVTATYLVEDDTGSIVGTAVVNLSTGLGGTRSVGATFASVPGDTLALKTNYIGNGDWEVEDSASTTTNIDATDPTATTVVQQFCNNANNSAVCTFTPASKTPTKATPWALLASGYNEPGSGGTSTISVSSGYDDQTSVNTGNSMTATMKIGGVLSIGVSKATGQTLSWDKTFSSSQSLDVAAGNTGYIWGQVPSLQYTGTMKVQVGNTTWNITNFTVTSPDPNGVLSIYHSGSWSGDYTKGMPSQPPADATAKA